MSFRTKIAIFFLTANLGVSSAIRAVRPDWPDTLVALLSARAEAQGDSARILLLDRAAFIFTDRLEDERSADSLSSIALDIAEKSGNSRLVILACNDYLENFEAAKRYEYCLALARKALYHCRRIHDLPLRWRTCINLSAVYASGNRTAETMATAREALAIATILLDNIRIAESWLCVGKAYELRKNVMATYRHYLRVRALAESLNDPGLLGRCYRQLFQFFKDNRLDEEASECVEKERFLILVNKPVDSLALFWNYYNYGGVRVRMPNSRLDEVDVRQVINYATRTRNNRLKSWVFSLYRTYLLKGDRAALLCQLYTYDYPEEFRRLHTADPEIYSRVTAYCKELAGETDSAAYYFAMAEDMILRSSGRGRLYKANFFNRYGEFLMRHGRKKEAFEKFDRAYQFCETERINQRFDYMIVAARNLEWLCREAGNYRKAWFYAAAISSITDSLSLSTKKDMLMAESLKQERRQKEASAEKDRMTIRQARNQRNMTLGGVGFFVVVTLLVYRNYRNQKRLNRLLDDARQKSDQLLLNILPHETAEELKQTGEAKARKFDEVTVMFTDFKDFTQASERMSAEELVDVINYYFTEFDRIVTRHNIEKIKIIGDSYMCAGGLPVPNTTHAADVVAAAVELRDFILAQKERREEEGKPYFEIRIGIHTGPVVAGIVGLKKFAYDIWGDTVNTASRMEGAGEPNRVNISSATYERVKDRFACTYRGKVSVKHKGEIEMYFVSGEH
ncbi:MAG TPA: adenylate/guanylate cyclase domain-containing protein [Bacteroidales bacterium]|nr:adenylate/guanylate cyclase domain-containing protein [Bacteroidales bacterium]